MISWDLCLEQRQGLHFHDKSKPRAVLVLSHFQVTLLVIVARHDKPIERTALREQLYTDVLSNSERASFSRSIARMEKADLIERYHPPAPYVGAHGWQTAQHIRLTKHGQAVISWLMNDWLGWAGYSKRFDLAG